MGLLVTDYGGHPSGRRIRGWMASGPVTHADFGSYATLKCGIEDERQRIAWLRWMVGRFTSHQAAEETGAPDGMVSNK